AGAPADADLTDATDDNQPPRRARPTAASPRRTASRCVSTPTPRRRYLFRRRTSGRGRGVRGAYSGFLGRVWSKHRPALCGAEAVVDARGFGALLALADPPPAH